MSRDIVILALLVLVVSSAMCMLVGIVFDWKIRDEIRINAYKEKYFRELEEEYARWDRIKLLQEQAAALSTTTMTFVYGDYGTEKDVPPLDAIHFYFLNLPDDDEIAVLLPFDIQETSYDVDDINRLIRFVLDFGDWIEASRHVWFKNYEVLRDRFAAWTFHDPKNYGRLLV